LATDIAFETALSWYTKAAEAGDSETQVILGKLYRKGDCIDQDLTKAVEWYTLAARQGNTVAQNCLSQLHQRGMLDDIELEEDMGEYLSEDSMNSRLCTKLSLDVSKLSDSPMYKQLNELVRRALIGDGHVMYETGLKYFKGKSDFTQDLETGVKWIKNAANAKYKHAQSMIADIYKKGDSIEQDYRKAAIWYKTHAKQKNPDAQCNVGIMYNEGLGVRYDPLEASKWFTWASDQGNSDGQYNLGMLRLKGVGIGLDRKEAVRWFLKSAHQRNIQACHKVGIIFFYGQGQIEKNTKRGLGLMEYAANNSNEYAQRQLGQEYGSESQECYDLPKSTLYYTMAADSGMQGTQCELTTIYLKENDTDRSYIKMYNLFKQATDRGYEFLKNFFETLLESLDNLDYSEILNMFIEVTKKGLDNLHYNIGSWYEHGVKWNGKYVLDINYASAAEWYLAASDNGDFRADYRLGIMHEYG
jgi:TPR repeat protein